VAGLLELEDHEVANVCIVIGDDDLGSVVVAPVARRRRGLLHLHEELDVALGLLEPLQEQLERLLTV
jgi:hypothetical protein